MADEDLVAKYDRLAPAYSSRYADPGAVASFFVRLVRTWLGRVEPGARVLEVSCADGFMTEALVRTGYRVVGIDLSPRMVETAAERLSRAGLSADLRVADVRTFELDEPVDVLLAPMWTFYHYLDDPAAVLQRLAPGVRAKAIVDLDPRVHRKERALDDLRRAGYRRMAARPVPVPKNVRLGGVGLKLLELTLHLPPPQRMILARKLNVAVGGSKT